MRPASALALCVPADISAAAQLVVEPFMLLVDVIRLARTAQPGLNQNLAAPTYFTEAPNVRPVAGEVPHPSPTPLCH